MRVSQGGVSLVYRAQQDEVRYEVCPGGGHIQLTEASASSVNTAYVGDDSGDRRMLVCDHRE